MSKNKQLSLFTLEPIPPEPNRKKWTRKFKKHCEEIYHNRGDLTGEYCCGYHWCCDKCVQIYCHGCSDCVHTIKQIAKEYGIEIDYNDFDFNKIESKIKEAYEKARSNKR